ncbi:MAG: XRE family transcriptional regulator, partial [Planctomycetota bacterium]
QVAALLKNESKYIPMEALSKICDYLIDHGHATPQQLPGALFAVQAENFWELLACRRDVEICVGVRQGEGSETPENAWVVASDSVLVGELLNGISTLGGTTKHIGEQESGEPGGKKGDGSGGPERLQQTLVWSPGQVSLEDARARAVEVHESFTDAQGDRAMICIGSVKSNPVVELIFSDAFGCSPFVTEDDLDDASSRACPFYLRYRDHDPKPDSSAAGMRLSNDEDAPKPGFYFEDEKEQWQHFGGEGQDTALVFYIFREPQGRLEMVLSGFSGRATRLLAKTLASRSEEFWPPQYVTGSVQVGAFIVQYEADEEPATRDDLLQTNVAAAATITPIPEAAISKRMSRL